MSSDFGRTALDALFSRLREAALERAPDLLEALDELQTHLEVVRGAAEGEVAAAGARLEAVDEERRRYEELFQRAPGAYVVTDATGKILVANRSAEELLAAGRTLGGRLLASFVSSEDRPPFRRAMLKIARTEGMAYLALPVRRGTSEEAAVVATARTVGGAGTSHRIHWLLVDRSELLEAERELPADERFERLAHTYLERLHDAYRQLEQERERMQRVLTGFPEGLVAFDRDLHVLFANSRARWILAPHLLRPGDPLPDPWDSFSLREYASELLDTRQPSLDRRLELEDGRVISLNGIPHRPGEDVFLLLADVTASTRRTRTEREFVRNAAHELRTPLTAISTAIEVLQSGAKEIPEERDRFLAHIERQAARLGRLTQSLLVLARAQSGQQAPRLEFVPLKPLLEEIAAALRPPDDVHLEVECEPDLALFVDRDLAEHAVLNLAVNATRHTRRGSVRIVARGVGERSVEIEIADDGEGILPEHRERLVEAFYRGTARDGEGFGLGLAISSQAIAVLGGSLEIDSEPGVGTRAVVTLPSARLVQT